MRAPVLVYALVQLALALAFVLDRAPGTDAALVGLPLDDAWIHLAYARAFAGVTDFAFTPGHVDPGFSSALWLAPLTLVGAIARDPRALVIATKVLGVALGVGCSVLAHRAASRISDRAAVPWIAGLLVALDPELAFARVSGMEVMLAAACVLAALVGLLERRPWVLGIALAGAALARLECALLAVCVGGLLWHRSGKERISIRKLLITLAPVVLAVSAWVMWCEAQAGRPFPNAWYVKHNPASAYHAMLDLPRVLRWVLEAPFFFAGSGLALAVLGARARLFRGADDRGRDALVVAFPLLFLLACVWAHAVSDEHAFYFRRYWLPVVPWALVLVAVGAGEAIEIVRRAAAGGRAWALRIGAAIALVVPAIAWVPRTLQQADLYAWNCENIEEAHVALGAWLAERTRPDEWIATHDVGAIRVFADRPILDLVGLQDHRIPHEFEAVRRETRPRYTVVFPSWFPRMARQQREVHRVESPHYTICDDCDQDVMVVLEDPRP